MQEDTPLILVGTGEYYTKILTPALKRLRANRISYPILTVDIRERSVIGDAAFDTLEHRIRKDGESLSSVLQDTKHLNPVIILGHANHMHVADAVDLANFGFSVLVEKPFALSEDELKTLTKIFDGFPRRVGLIEYYLTMKSTPLYTLTGQLKMPSFLLDEGIMLAAEDVGNALNAQLGSGGVFEAIGKIEAVDIEVLEGEGAVGSLAHRGAHIVSKTLGGGMIQDLGIHALAPLIPLERWIGRLSLQGALLKTARCREYIDMAKAEYDLTEDDTAETFGEVRLVTSNGVPVTMRIGKYVLQNENRRGIKIRGEWGDIELDLSNPSVHVRIKGQEFRDIFTLPKTDEKYYPVIRSSLLELAGRSPYDFSISGCSLRAQELVLGLIAIRDREGIGEQVYERGVEPTHIVDITA
jgi:predicted dehydrogenase